MRLVRRLLMRRRCTTDHVRLQRLAPCAGVFATNPRQAPGTVTFREAIPMGETSLSPRQVYAVVQELGQQFRGNAYHLLQQNCNTFSDELCFRLTGLQAPPWVCAMALVVPQMMMKVVVIMVMIYLSSFTTGESTCKFCRGASLPASSGLGATTATSQGRRAAIAWC